MITLNKFQHNVLSLKQFLILLAVNICIWILVASTRKCPEIDPALLNAANNPDLANFTDSMPNLLPLDDGSLESNQLLRPVRVGPNKKMIRTKSHLPCPLELDAEKKFRTFEINTSPKFELNRQKFLLNITPGELNTLEEQIQSFKENLFLAIYLNRTIVLPNFFKSLNDHSIKTNLHAKNLIDPQDWIAMNKLMKYVPVITLDELYEHCTRFDIAYMLKSSPPLPLHKSILDEMERIEKFTGVHILDETTNRFRGTFVKAKKNENGEVPVVRLNSDYIQHEYFDMHRDDSKCALTINPKNDIAYISHLQQWADQMGGDHDYVSIDTDLPLVSAMVMKATGRPKYVKSIVDKFKDPWTSSLFYIFPRN